MTQLRRSNIPDSSQACSCSVFMQDKLDNKYNICRSKSQDGELKNRSTAMFIDRRILKRPDQPGIDLGLGLGFRTTEGLPIE